MIYWFTGKGERNTHINDEVAFTPRLMGIFHLLNGEVLENPAAVPIDACPVGGQMPIK